MLSGDTLTLTNNGNIPDVTTLHATIGFSLNADGSSPIGSTASATSHKYTIKPGKSVKIHSTAWKAITAGLLTGVPYYLTVTVTDATGNTASAVSTTSFML